RFAPPYRSLCELAAARGQLLEALDFCKQYLARAPRSVPGWCRLADLEVRAHRYASALRDAEHALQLDPACPQANLIAGLLHERRSEGTPALDQLARAAAAYPQDARVLRAYGRVLALTQHYDQAIPALRQAVAREPARAEAYRWLGYAYARLPATPQNDRQAETNFQQALRLWPRYPEANFEMARFYLNRGQAARAQPYADRAVQLRKHYQQALYVRWRIALALARPEDAARFQKQFQRESYLASRRAELLSRYKLDPTSLSTALALARTLQALDEKALAAHYLLETLQHHPDDPRLSAALDSLTNGSRPEGIRRNAERNAQQ
ncbi:MAG TPA: tetratricopeptide repeat protein, partial [Chthonomonadaceae bacterium]|nr:tetratricopeptide repeat protein [Chthonomonadaceae bacterium]